MSASEVHTRVETGNALQESSATEDITANELFNCFMEIANNPDLHDCDQMMQEHDQSESGLDSQTVSQGDQGGALDSKIASSCGLDSKEDDMQRNNKGKNSTLLSVDHLLKSEASELSSLDHQETKHCDHLESSTGLPPESTELSTKTTGEPTESAGIQTESPNIFTESTGVPKESHVTPIESTGMPAENTGLQTISTGTPTETTAVPTESTLHETPHPMSDTGDPGKADDVGGDLARNNVDTPDDKRIEENNYFEPELSEQSFEVKDSKVVEDDQSSSSEVFHADTCSKESSTGNSELLNNKDETQVGGSLSKAMEDLADLEKLLSTAVSEFQVTTSGTDLEKENEEVDTNSRAKEDQMSQDKEGDLGVGNLVADSREEKEKNDVLLQHSEESSTITLKREDQENDVNINAREDRLPEDKYEDLNRNDFPEAEENKELDSIAGNDVNAAVCETGMEQEKCTENSLQRDVLQMPSAVDVNTEQLSDVECSSQKSDSAVMLDKEGESTSPMALKMNQFCYDSESELANDKKLVEGDESQKTFSIFKVEKSEGLKVQDTNTESATDKLSQQNFEAGEKFQEDTKTVQESASPGVQESQTASAEAGREISIEQSTSQGKNGENLDSADDDNNYEVATPPDIEVTMTDDSGISERKSLDSLDPEESSNSRPASLSAPDEGTDSDVPSDYGDEEENDAAFDADNLKSPTTCKRQSWCLEIDRDRSSSDSSVLSEMEFKERYGKPDCTDGKSSGKDYMRGHLMKLGGTGLTPKNWRKRWCVLRSDKCLYYYKTSKDKVPCGAIILSNYSVSKAPEINKGHCFKLTKGGAKTYFLCAASEADMKKWMVAMMDAIKESAKEANPFNILEGNVHNVSIPALSIRDPDCHGYLYKQGNSYKMWRKRYFVLKNGFLYYYTDMSNTVALGVAKLLHYSVSTGEQSGKKFYFSAVAPDQLSRSYQFATESEMDRTRWLARLEDSIKKGSSEH